MILAVISSLIGLSSAKMTQAAMNGSTSHASTLQASVIAATDLDLLRSIEYKDLASSAKAAVPDSPYFHEIIVSNESSYSDTIKQKTATVKVYKGSETTPRAFLTFKRYSVSSGSSVPAGSIIPWYGNLANIPDGFALCDGKNGTPDLRDRFLVGAGNAYKLGDIGGENSVKLSATQIGNHYHAFGSYDNNNGWFVRLPSYATFPMPPGSGRAW